MNENRPFRRYADIVNTVAAILLILLQTYQGSQARHIQNTLDDIEVRQKVILERMKEDVGVE